MDWHVAIERNREALRRVLAVLVAMAGLPLRAVGSGQSGPVGVPAAEVPRSSDCPLPIADCPTLPRHLHRAVLRLLRPAESAARRLIIVAARALADRPEGRGDASAEPRAGERETVPPPRKPAPKSAVPALRGLGIAVVVPAGGVVLPAGSKAPPRRAFALPLADRLRASGPRLRTVPPHAAPRILSLEGAVPHRLPPKPSPYDRLDATRLGQRLAALAAVLEDLSGQARRFLRWQARRARDMARGRWRRPSPLRYGRPPGQRPERSREPAEQEVLRDLHYFALQALAPPDTS